MKDGQLLKEAIELIKYFVNRVDEGTIRSTVTYDKYKNFLLKVEKLPIEKQESINDEEIDKKFPFEVERFMFKASDEYNTMQKYKREGAKLMRDHPEQFKTNNDQ